MTLEWILTLLTDPQGFWELLGYYLTATFTDYGIDTTVFSEFWESVLNHPLRLLVAVIFLFLLCITLLVCRIGIACDSHSEKTAAFEPLSEREASYDI